LRQQECTPADEGVGAAVIVRWSGARRRGSWGFACDQPRGRRLRLRAWRPSASRDGGLCPRGLACGGCSWSAASARPLRPWAAVRARIPGGWLPQLGGRPKRARARPPPPGRRCSRRAMPQGAGGASRARARGVRGVALLVPARPARAAAGRPAMQVNFAALQAPAALLMRLFCPF
jgi:hypothetical protein